ncbi:MAG: VCBS repeat-containing protein [Flavobacteriales bacterium]|nr:VCBS repeat-containing protein [Flavobacteriales bacterium]
MKPLFPLTLALLGTLPTLAQDNCASAVPITAGTYVVSTVNGNQVPSPICAPNGAGASAGEWYSYTPTSNYTVTINTAIGALTDSRVHVYLGGCGALACVAGDDDSGVNNTALLTFNVAAGFTYIIAFDNRWSSSGFTFQLVESPIVIPVFSFSPLTLPAGIGSTVAAVDMNGDHLDDVVRVTELQITINHQQTGGGLVQTVFPTDTADTTPYWSLAAGDLDGNGYNDLLYAGGSATFMLANADATAYIENSQTEWIFCQRSNFVDINNDGHLDAFVCHDVEPNVYYLNDGQGNLTYYQGGLGDTPDGGNYGSIWVDYDNDHDVDLFIAKCRGGVGPANIDQLHRNNGDGTWTEVAALMNLADNQQSWSSAWGDYDNDGDMDVLQGASSFTNGGHKLMRNDGSTFTNVTVGSGFDVHSGQSIEWITHDFDNDGWLDVLGGGKLLRNNGDMTFSLHTVTPTNGPVGDLDNDGYLDIVNGGTVHMNALTGNNWLKVTLEGTVSNTSGIGARVEIQTPAGTQIRDIRSGDGFRYMSTLNAHFGLGQESQVDQITVYWTSGIVDVISAPAINGTVHVIEGLSTGVATVTPEATLSTFPNPVDNVLYLSSSLPLRNANATVLNTAGQPVLRSVLREATLDIAGLAPGVYVLQVEQEGTLLQERFVKR